MECKCVWIKFWYVIFNLKIEYVMIYILLICVLNVLYYFMYFWFSDICFCFVYIKLIKMRLLNDILIKVDCLVWK